MGRVIWNGTMFGLGAGVVHQAMTEQMNDAVMLFLMFVLCQVAEVIDKQRGL